MFDFRYHALSLVAVFLALGIGIVLGASLGDTVVSQANKDVSSSLRDDVVKARADARTEQQAVRNRDAFIAATFDRLAGGRLNRRRVAIVAFGGLPPDIEGPVRDAVDGAGGSVDSVSKFDSNLDLTTIGEKIGGRFKGLGAAGGPPRGLARKLAQQLVRGGPAAGKLKDALPDSFRGDFRGADAVVYYRADIASDDRSKRFESALLEGLRASRVPVVGVERSEEDPSQIASYTGAGLSTVDDVDQPAGRIAVVLALAGTKGHFGFKSTADAPLPPLRRG